MDKRALEEDCQASEHALDSAQLFSKAALKSMHAQEIYFCESGELVLIILQSHSTAGSASSHRHRRKR